MGWRERGEKGSRSGVLTVARLGVLAWSLVRDPRGWGTVSIKSPSTHIHHSAVPSKSAKPISLGEIQAINIIISCSIHHLPVIPGSCRQSRFYAGWKLLWLRVTGHWLVVASTMTVRIRWYSFRWIMNNVGLFSPLLTILQ